MGERVSIGVSQNCYAYRMRFTAYSTILLLTCAALAQQPVGKVSATDASVKGNMVLGKEGAMVMSGAQVQAGSVTAQIKLARGGDVNVCPNSSVSVSASATGDELMFAMGNGTIETHYRLGAHSDVVITPEFRIQLSGPGAFHLAVNIRKNGDTCVESLPFNGSATIITETFGDGTYQLQTGKSVVFHGGKVSGVTENAAPSCGCPPPAASAPPPQFDPGLSFPREESERAASLAAEGKPMPNPYAGSPMEQGQPGKMLTKVDAPIVFDGSIIPLPTDVQRDKLWTLPPQINPYPKVTGPEVTDPKVNGPNEQKKADAVQPAGQNPQPNQKEEPKKKWYQRLGSAISKIFK